VKSLIVIGVALLGGALAACATPPKATVASGCGPGERPAEVAQLFFGRNIGDKPGVSEADWDAFLDRELVSRFPEGLSVIDTAGVWRGKDGVAVHELGKAVVIVLSGAPGENDRITAVTEAYKARFSQDSVLTSRSRSCVAS
jgi:formylmethanofuran dehydrogenase subunit E